MITEQSTIAVTQGLTAADLGGEAVVLDPNSGRYYGLNELGARIFDLARKPRSVEWIMEALLQEYDVEERKLKEDLLAFLHEMEQRQLIEVTDGPAA
ncbi:MAG: PqqD family peptide modification chaperone [Bacteroidota bacterium]